MKITFSSLLLFITLFAFAQPKKGFTEQELRDLAGKWTGTLTYTDYSDDKTQVSLVTKLEITDLVDSVGLNFVYTEPNGKEVTDKSSLRLYDDGDKMNIAGEEFFVAATHRKGARLTVIVENDGIDNNKEAEIRYSITMGPDILILLKEVKYTGMKEYFVRNKTELIKK